MVTEFKKFFINAFCRVNYKDLDFQNERNFFYEKKFPKNKLFCVKNSSKKSFLFCIKQENFENNENFKDFMFSTIRSAIILNEIFIISDFSKNILNVFFIIFNLLLKIMIIYIILKKI